MKDTNVDVRAPRCTQWSPPWFTGRWRDWHRGHGCHLDDGQPRSPEGAREIEEGERRVAAGEPPVKVDPSLDARQDSHADILRQVRKRRRKA